MQMTVCLHPSWELRLEATTSTRTIRTRLLSPCLTSACTRTTTAGTSTTTFACSLSRAQSAWDPTLEQSACHPAWKSTPRAPSAPFPDGEPPLRVEASPVFSRRSTSLSCLTTTAVTPTDRPTSLTPRSVPVLTRAARTPARETLAVHSCAATSFPELSLGDTGVLRLATQEYTHRLPTSSTGSTPTCKNVILNPSPQQIHSPNPLPVIFSVIQIQ